MLPIVLARPRLANFCLQLATLSFPRVTFSLYSRAFCTRPAGYFFWCVLGVFFALEPCSPPIVPLTLLAFWCSLFFFTNGLRTGSPSSHRRFFSLTYRAHDNSTFRLTETCQISLLALNAKPLVFLVKGKRRRLQSPFGSAFPDPP